MIAKMKKVFIYGLSGESAKLISGLQRLGCLHVQNPEGMPAYEQIKQHITSRPAELYSSEQRISRLANTIAALSNYTGKKSLFARRPRADFSCVEDRGLETRAEEICQSVEEQLSRIANIKAKISRQEFYKLTVSPWIQSDISLEFAHTNLVSVDYFIFPASISLDELKESLAEQKISALLKLISQDKDQQYAVFMSYTSDMQKALGTVREFGGSRVSFEGLIGNPKQCIQKADEKIARYHNEIEEATHVLEDLAKQKDVVELAYDVQLIKLDCSKAQQNLMHTENTFILTAWVPEEKTQKVEKYLNTITCYYEISQPDPQEEPPVLLKNNKLVEPFEVITEMYSLPVSGSIDPDPFIAIFYFIFFGMMLSDAGYGLVLMVGGLLALKFMDLGDFAKKFAKFLALCGLSTVMWGAAYGSWFGNAVNQFSLSFLGKDINVPALLDPLNDPITILIISFALGAIHLFVGMGLKAYLMIKRGDAWGALFDVGFWYLVLVGLPLMVIPGAAGQAGKVMAIVGAIGLILTQGREKPSFVGKMISGVLSLYDITGYFSDVLSYSRILALGLATGVIANVINIMGTLPGGNIFGFLMFIVVFIFGHALNFAINVLGSYVHTSRLQYVEFFGKFYEGGGKPFEPLAANTKYVVVTNNKEE